MIVSLEAIFLSTFVMISQNRADAKRQVLGDQAWVTVQEEKRQNQDQVAAFVSDSPVRGSCSLGCAAAPRSHLRERSPPPRGQGPTAESLEIGARASASSKPGFIRGR
jgi:hypothetical protein